MAKLIAILILISLVATSVYAEEKDEHHDEHDGHEGWGEWFVDWFLGKCAGKGGKGHKRHRGHGSGSGNGGGGEGGSTTPVPIRNCTNPGTTDTIQQICYKICYDCQCGDSSLNDTCYTNCTTQVFANDSICKMDITTQSSEEDPDNPIYTYCAVTSTEISDSDNYEGTTNDFCNQACTCCDLNAGDSNCVTECQNSQLLGVMAQACAQVQAQPSFMAATAQVAAAKAAKPAAPAPAAPAAPAAPKPAAPVPVAPAVPEKEPAAATTTTTEPTPKKGKD